jgi:dienelactone hydrolase
VFQYYRANGRWTALRSVRVPIAAIVGERDEFLDRTAETLLEAFRQNATRTRSFSGQIVAGAGHGFAGHERALADALVRWVKLSAV